ncbi:DNA topoisomerase 1 [Natronomonas pharaonis DSM 2160]|uniref:DNA topoisomerase 1 n=1 Tax=Natronomonas pharaonis (strain ATCC 35678 / DSM 2160 / CIP 103997 / JCM 8858 / NBRC 14720 / NCIMB 2260 / Gabara) TaxID=348780 RepID=A0A1U7EUR4_NATPD|nr:DNA topoisomerase I [Natronomonas pharaonis]CAI48702.1 DNA topoisomerase 1 [Natronomonas pharaonis DSM 2160]
MELIVTEKDNAARRIAEILSDGSASTERRNGVNVYRWGDKRCVGLSGHVVGVDFPPEYEDWRDVQPVELVEADVVKKPTQENIVRTLKQLAGEADRATIATDYDREGELIGKEAYELIREEADIPIQRVRFSSITENEVKEAFATPDDLDFDLAAAGEARQIVDLLWGAALTRFLSLSANQLGDDFISVGRVQSPTLKLIVDREREIEAFDPDDYWELFADLAREGTTFEAQYFYREDGTEQERVWDESGAETAFETLRNAGTAVVESVRRRRRTDEPPEPFNTTQYISAANGIGLSAQRAMSVAEELYTAGYITYPRTDNTVYPDDLDPEALLSAFTDHYLFADDAEMLRSADDIEPTAGDEETTDHPPIHPTGEIPNKDDLSDDEWEVYELVVRHFFATVADAAEWEHLKVVADADGCSLKANGKRLVEPGYHEVYPYRSTSENHVPAVEEGEQLAIEDARIEEKQTQPPRRRGQSRLIEELESRGLGTKSTRHNTLQKLYDRGYIESDPPRPTKLAMAVVEAAEQFADRIVDEEMTAQLESDMQAIVDGEKDLEAVTEESRALLGRIFDELHDSREEIGEHLQESMKADRMLGPCPECGEDLLIRRSRKGSYFVGCDGFPDCRYTLPLPSQGEPTVIDEACTEHDLNHVKMLAGRSTFVHGCPQCKADEADETDDRIIGDCPDCGDNADGELAIKQLRSGSRLVGCTRYPECEYSLPLPRRGDIEVLDERCADHDLPHLRVVDNGDDPWELGCPICNYTEYREQQAASAIEDLDGVGQKTAEKLADAGIESLSDLRGADAEAVANEVQGVSEDRLREWQAEANVSASAD